MSYTILHKQILSPDIKRLDIFAPQIARKVQAGQFVSVSAEEGDKRIPLTVIEADPSKGSITLIVQERGETTRKLGTFVIQDSFFSILGPLGVPATIQKRGMVICISTGIGTAQILPIARAFKKEGNKVIGIVGARTKKTLLLEAQMRLSCHKIFIATEDGSYERRGQATDILKELIQKLEKEGQDFKNFLVYAIGSTEMMQAVSEFTRSKGVQTLLQVNPMMVDCMGMCGSCRLKVGGKIVLACVQGPEFDGHQVDFEDLNIRLNAFWGIKK